MFLLIVFVCYKSYIIKSKLTHSNYQRVTIIPIFFIYYTFPLYFLSNCIELWVRLITLNISNFYLCFIIVSKTVLLIWLFAKLIFVIPFVCSSSFSNPAESIWLELSFRPLILWCFLAFDIDYMILSFWRLHSDKSKKSVNVLFIKSDNLLSVCFILLYTG